MVGFILFLAVEKYLHWHHCGKGLECTLEKKTLGQMILFGDGVHNFLDGLIIGASFLISIPFGWITTLIIITHELPQEIGDFGILVYSGYKRSKALLYNFISQLTCVLGGLSVFLFRDVSALSNLLIPLAAGGFIYIAASDLIPELRHTHQASKSLAYLLFFLLGVSLIYLFSLV